MMHLPGVCSAPGFGDLCTSQISKTHRQKNNQLHVINMQRQTVETAQALNWQLDPAEVQGK